MHVNSTEFFKIRKSPIPIFFIDTFALISYAKNDDIRIIELLDVAAEKVKQGKLICPISDQLEETDIKEYTNAKNKAVHAFYNIGFMSRRLIREKQFISSVNLYNDNKSSIVLSYEDAFSVNPINQINDIISDGLCICTNKVISEEIKEIETQSITEMVKTFTNWKKNKGKLDFEKEMFECTGFKYKNTLEIISRAHALNINSNDYLAALDNEYFLFKKIFQNSTLSDYLNFIKSDYYKFMPSQYIAAHILANYFSKESEKPMGHGDPMDINYISTYMPYCDFMLIDNNQVKVLKKFKLDELFETKIFSLKIHSDLLTLLKSL